MNDQDKTKDQLINELRKLHKRNAELEASEIERKKTEEELVKSSLKYRSLIEKAGAGVATADLKGRFTSVNKALCKMLGYSEEELIGKQFARFLHPGEKKEILKLFWNAWKDPQKEAYLEFRVIHKDGHALWLYSKPTLFMYKNKIAGFNAIITDITEHKRAEEKLKESEELYRDIIELAPDGILTMDLKGVIKSINASFLKLTGFSREQIVNKHFTKLPTIRLRDMPKYIKMFNSLIMGEIPKPFEFKWVHKDGSLHIGEIHVSPMKKRGKTTGFQAITRDITDRKQAEEKLRESEEKYRHIVEMAPDGIVTTDLKGRITSFNFALSKQTGYSRDEFMNRHFSKLPTVRAQDIPRYVKAFNSLIRGKVPKPFEYKWIHKDGTTRVGEIYISLMKKRGKIIGFQAMTRDITKRKQTEEQIKASLKEKDVLLREIHHRVKNNMQIISSLLRLQSGTIKNKKTLEMFKVCEDRIRSMAFIHETLYRAENLAKIDFSDYIKKLTSYLFSVYSMERSAVRLKLEVKNVLMDINRAVPCGLIINELVSNSLKHAFLDGMKGEIGVKMKAEKNGKYTLIMRDNGAGFPEDLDFLETETLGLHLVKSLVRQIDGTIELDRKAGTTFKITF